MTGSTTGATRSFENNIGAPDQGFISFLGSDDAETVLKFTLDKASAVSFGIFDVASSDQAFFLETFASDFALGDSIGGTILPAGQGSPNSFKYSGVGGIWTDSLTNDVTMFTLTHQATANVR